MKMLWCWRCQMEVAMLDDAEYAVARQLFGNAFDSVRNAGKNVRERFQPLLDYYYDVTGCEETNPNAVIHHGIALYGPPCENCGKPYRTPEASFCAACGNKRL